MDEKQFEEIRRYTGFDDSTGALLRELHERIAPALPALIDDFYAAIDADPQASLVLTGGEEQRARLHRTLTGWLESSLIGPHDGNYLRARRRIGLVHVRIGLEQRYMLTAMSRIRTGLMDMIAKEYAEAPDKRHDAQLAVNRLLDVELTIMLDSYYAHLAERVRNAERLATIGQLTATIGHELRNPLGIIESSMFLLKQRFARLQLDDPQITKHNERVQKQVQHCSNTITNLLDLARDRPPKRRRQDARAVIHRVLEELELGPDIQVDIPEHTSVDLDADDFGHVLTNLLSNASDAMGGKGTIFISAARRSGGTEVVVQDSGPGIPEEIRPHVFDALFTTKPRGTGLGLALCRRILYAHGGELELEPSERGARFRLWFPDLPEGAEEPPESEG